MARGKQNPVEAQRKGCVSDTTGDTQNSLVNFKRGTRRKCTDWPRENDDPIKPPIWQAVCHFEYGTDNYWTASLMIEQAINVAVRIANIAFPHCEALFAFDNASDHCSFAADALLATKMNPNTGDKQPMMRNGHHNGHIQQMAFPKGTTVAESSRGNAKGIRQVLLERGP